MADEIAGIVGIVPPSFGVSGLASARRNNFFPYKHEYPADLSDCRVNRMRPWRITIWEPLPTTAPGVSKADPWCCYIKTVIFYDRFSGDEIDRLDTRLQWDDVVTFDGDEWEVGGGKVQWIEGRWWMERWARRIAQTGLASATEVLGSRTDPDKTRDEKSSV